MIYWVTQTAPSSARIYYESRHRSGAGGRRGASRCRRRARSSRKEIIWSPRRWVEPRFNLARWTTMPRGGHFAALEQPQLLVDDVRAFFRSVR